MVRNMWWSWNLDAIELFRRIDLRLWNESGRNPINFFPFFPSHSLRAYPVMTVLCLTSSGSKTLLKNKRNYRPNSWNPKAAFKGTVAYFSMEYGIHESLPLYAGGLGMLAGDHLKAASDRGTPLVAVGLLYRMGYFHQFMDQNGWQQERYPETDLFQLPIERATDINGKELYISVTGPDG